MTAKRRIRSEYYYLDTNMLAYMIFTQKNISRQVREIIEDYNTKFLTSRAG